MYSLDEAEYKSLSDRYGEANARAYITRLSNHMSSKDKSYADHAATLSRWLEEDLQKGQINLPVKEISMPNKCDKCGKTLVDGVCKDCKRRVYGSGGKYEFFDMMSNKDIEEFESRASSFF